MMEIMIFFVFQDTANLWWLDAGAISHLSRAISPIDRYAAVGLTIRHAEVNHKKREIVKSWNRKIVKSWNRKIVKSQNLENYKNPKA